MIDITKTYGLLIDIQERLLPHMNGHQVLLDRTKVLIHGLNKLDVPVLITQQYTRGLGPTVHELAELLPGNKPVEKISFSCCAESAVVEILKYTSCKYVLVFGIEAHVCVLQTVLDLLDMGFIPFVVADCIGSRKSFEMQYALQRMEKSGAIITTTESVLFEMLRSASHLCFKEISQFIK